MKRQPCVNCKRKIDPEKDFLCPYCGRLHIIIDMIDAIGEMANLSVKLNNKINSLRKFFDTLNLPYDDARNQFLGSISMMTGWLIIQLVMYRDYARTTKSPIALKIVESNPNMTIPQLGEMIKNFDLMNRRSYLTSFMFQMEVFLKRINEILPKISTDYGYKKLVKHLLKELGTITKDNEKFRILYFPAVVRNSLHTNGIHTEKDIKGTIDGMPFSFKNQKHVGHASWRHVYFFCDHMLEILEEILKHKKVGKIPLPPPHPISKTY